MINLELEISHDFDKNLPKVDLDPAVIQIVVFSAGVCDLGRQVSAGPGDVGAGDRGVVRHPQQTQRHLHPAGGNTEKTHVSRRHHWRHPQAGNCFRADPPEN